MKSAFRKLLLTLVALELLAASAIAGEFFIKDGDRVVFLGDSITEQRLYTTYIEAYALTRHPGMETLVSQRRLGRRYLLAAPARASG